MYTFSFLKTVLDLWKNSNLIGEVDLGTLNFAKRFGQEKAISIRVIPGTIFSENDNAIIGCVSNYEKITEALSRPGFNGQNFIPRIPKEILDEVNSEDFLEQKIDTVLLYPFYLEEWLKQKKFIRVEKSENVTMISPNDRNYLSFLPDCFVMNVDKPFIAQDNNGKNYFCSNMIIRKNKNLIRCFIVPNNADTFVIPGNVKKNIDLFLSKLKTAKKFLDADVFEASKKFDSGIQKSYKQTMLFVSKYFLEYGKENEDNLGSIEKEDFSIHYLPAFINGLGKIISEKSPIQKPTISSVEIKALEISKKQTNQKRVKNETCQWYQTLPQKTIQVLVPEIKRVIKGGEKENHDREPHLRYYKSGNISFVSASKIGEKISPEEKAEKNKSWLENNPHLAKLLKK